MFCEPRPTVRMIMKVSEEEVSILKNACDKAYDMLKQLQNVREEHNINEPLFIEECFSDACDALSILNDEIERVNDIGFAD